MHRDPVARPAAMLMGGILAALLAVSAVAAEPSRSATNDASAATLQQRLETAQRSLERAAQEVADLSTSISEEARVDSRTGQSRRPQRATLGVNVGTDADGKRREGVQILNVVPRSGAYEAGLKSGDLLLAVNNTELRLDDEGSPREKLFAVMRSLREGDKIPVKYRRGGFTRTIGLITRPIRELPAADTSLVAPAALATPPVPVTAAAPALRPQRADTPRVAVRRLDAILGGTELVPLTPQLGQYFGTDEGLLVVRAPANATLDIQEGDVILEIDGRIPDSTAHAVRILRSYRPGEELTLSVYRKKRSFNIDIVIPEEAPRARQERRSDRPPSNERALRQRPRAPAVVPQAPVPEASAVLQVQPLPDDEVEIESDD